jgi:hypothetical protein
MSCDFWWLKLQLAHSSRVLTNQEYAAQTPICVTLLKVPHQIFRIAREIEFGSSTRLRKADVGMAVMVLRADKRSCRAPTSPTPAYRETQSHRVSNNNMHKCSPKYTICDRCAIKPYPSRAFSFGRLAKGSSDEGASKKLSRHYKPQCALV